MVQLSRMGHHRHDLTFLLTGAGAAVQNLTKPQLTQLHQQLLAGGHLLRSPSHTAGLLRFYAAAGDLAAAFRLLSSLPEPVSFLAATPLLSLLSRSRLHLETLALFSRLRLSSLPDPLAFVPALLSSASASVRTGALRVVASLHADAVKLAGDAAAPVSGALVAAYSRCGDLAAARRAFDLAAARRGVVTWNAIVAAYAAAGDVDEAVRLAESMASNGCEPDVVTLNSIIAGLCRAGRCGEASVLLRRMPWPNAISYTAIISGYARCGDYEAAIAMFREMVANRGVLPDAKSLSCVTSCCRHVCAFLPGRAAHGYGLKNVDADAFYASAGAALITMYAACGKVLAAQSVFCAMDPLDIVTWNAMISGFANARLDQAALDCFREMHLHGVTSNATTVVTVLTVCDLSLGKQIHGYFARNHDGVCNMVSNALVSMYSRAGCVGAASRVFLSIRAKDVVSWNTMIGVYASHGLGEQALDLVNRMKHCGTGPDAITFTTVLMACCHCGLVDEGLEVFERFVQREGLVPTMEQCSCIVDLLARAGRFQEAVEFIDRMPMRPNATVWGALLSASRMHHNVEFGQMAFEQLVRLEPENPGNFVTISNIYANAGRLEDAKRVRMMIEREELVKPSGYSRVEAM